MNATAHWAGMLREATTWILPVIFAVTFHEAAHGFVARRLGDDTAWRAGRVTFNPLKHIDPFGTVVLPALLFCDVGLLFGYAKPVPVNFARLNHPRRDMVLVALAGPGTNVLLAIVSALLFYALAVTPAGVRGMARPQSGEFVADQRGAVRLQHAAVAAARRRPGGGRVSCRISWRARWPGSNPTAC